MLEMRQTFRIMPLSQAKKDQVQQSIDQRTKPPGSLGRLEELALQMAMVQDDAEPKIQLPTMLVFAGDHGLAKEGVSPYPQDVTAQMVLNFIAGGAAINAFCKQNEMSLWVINAGVKGGLDQNQISCQNYIDAAVAGGTANSAEGPAMTWDQLNLCLERGAAIASQRLQAGCNVIGMGEMGIGNSSAAALVTSLLTKAPLDQTLCPGTGCDAEGLKHKYQVLIKAHKLHENHEGPWDILRRVGGFEMAMAAGAMARACEEKRLVLVDGYIMTAVALVLAEALPAARDYMVFCHKSASIGHQVALRHLQAEPLLDLKMRLGEGTGVAVALPLLHSALAFYRDMATFAGAGVATAD